MIVDASVVVKWFAAEVLHDEARSLLVREQPLIAPDIVVAEVANALWLKVGRGEMPDQAAGRAVAAVAGSGEPELRPSQPLAGAAFELARQLDHPVSDCFYLALARQLDLELVTADGRLVEVAASEFGGQVRLLA